MSSTDISDIREYTLYMYNNYQCTVSHYNIMYELYVALTSPGRAEKTFLSLLGSSSFSALDIYTLLQLVYIPTHHTKERLQW